MADVGFLERDIDKELFVQFAGIGVLAVGAWTVASRHRYVALLPTPTYAAIAYLLVIAGALGVPLSALGCCGLKTENRTSLLCVSIMQIVLQLLHRITCQRNTMFYSCFVLIF